jgi:hypothetical protein
MEGHTHLLVFASVVAALPTLSFVLAFVSGWRSLARRYPTSMKTAKETFACPLSWFGSGANYGGLVRVGFREQGVVVRPFIVLRCFHPPFEVPWERVSMRKATHWMFGERLELILDGEEDGLHVFLSRSAEAEIPRHVQ